MKTVIDNVTAAFGADDSYFGHIKAVAEKSNTDYADDSFSEALKGSMLQTLAA